jgi:hypothetical protein
VVCVPTFFCFSCLSNKEADSAIPDPLFLMNFCMTNSSTLKQTTGSLVRQRSHPAPRLSVRPKNCCVDLRWNGLIPLTTGRYQVRRFFPFDPSRLNFFPVCRYCICCKGSWWKRLAWKTCDESISFRIRSISVCRP